MIKIVAAILIIVGIAGLMYWMYYDSGLDEKKANLEAKIGAYSALSLIAGTLIWAGQHFFQQYLLQLFI